MTFTELAWAAGLFEGEGCINGYVNKSGERGIQLMLRMTDEDVVQRFQSVIGFGNIHKRAPLQSHHKRSYLWHVGSFERAQAVIAALWPWLGRRRRATAKRVLREYVGRVSQRDRQRVVRAQVADALRRGGRTQRSIAREFGLSEPSVSRIARLA